MSDQPPTYSLPAHLVTQLREALMAAHDPQDFANELLSFALAACVSLSQGSADDAVTLYQNTIDHLNALVKRHRERNTH